MIFEFKQQSDLTVSDIAKLRALSQAVYPLDRIKLPSRGSGLEWAGASWTILIRNDQPNQASAWYTAIRNCLRIG